MKLALLGDIHANLPALEAVLADIELRSYYLLNLLEEGERGFKLILTQTDKLREAR